MFIYSKKIIEFVDEIKAVIRGVLSREIGLEVLRDRFLDRFKSTSYPIKVVIYNNKSILGFFDSDFYELGFHERLMHAKKEHLHQVIKHELAHYITFINHGPLLYPHGAEFKAFCQKMGWGEEISRASMCLDEANSAHFYEESAILRKVQKLMALTNSSNIHEAEQAMIKSQQLLMQHNIEAKFLADAGDEKIVLKRVLKQKRIDAKMRCIGRILPTFFVTVVYSRGGEYTYLEVLGDAVNVEIAEYVANFLQRELESLWQQAEMQGSIRGLVAKNSFLHGIAKGYCDKVQALKKEYTQEVTTALMLIERKLMQRQSMVYPRLTSYKSSGQYCQESSRLGEQMGRHLSINPALQQAAKKSERLLPML